MRKTQIVHVECPRNFDRHPDQGTRRKLPTLGLHRLFAHHD